MNNSPKLVSFAGSEWAVSALKPGTQWLIAQEAIKINKAESANYGDVVRQFAANIPSVVRVLTLALLNDRQKIYANGRDGEYSELFNTTYDSILWNTDQGSWISLLVEVINLLDIEVFFSTTSSITILRQRLLERKTTMEEQKLLLHEQSGGK